ncbi:MAG TPA: SGNH/GDSL hydrolase family protein, partial [Planctomycetota bacterium]|nr:SGNH/GDSL hydrolase family protein [Planctomycetota bacterium]
MSSARRLAAKVLLSAGTLALLAGLAEVALRVLGPPPPAAASPLGLPGILEAGSPFTRPDELLLYAIVPHATTYPWYAIDAHGYRTTEFSDTKAPGALRVIAAGDSTTFGLGVLEELRWSSLLRRALAGLCADVRAVEVINAGVPGYSLVQDRLQIERDLLPLQPDVLALLVTGWNDSTLVEGPDDAELAAARRSVAGKVSRLRLAQLLGARPVSLGAPPPKAQPGSGTARSRVSPERAAEALSAVADELPGRLVLGIFQSQEQLHASPDAGLFARRVAELAAARGVPLADARPALAALLPYPLSLDGVHPTPLAHVAIARAMLAAVLPELDLPAPRAAWCRAFLAASAGDIAAQAETLRGEGAPPAFRELLALCAPDPGSLDARLAQHDASLPPAVLDWDPLEGRRARTRSAARLLLSTSRSAPRSAEDEARLAELAAHVRPADPLVACFADEAALAAAPAPLLALARAVVIFGAQLGLPVQRVDSRRGEAALAGDPAAAVALLDAALALDGDDEACRADRAWALRRAGRRDESHADFARLAEGRGALADFSCGLLAWEARDLPAAETALRAAIAAEPAMGYAHQLLGRTLLARDRLDEATRELTLSSVLMGSAGEIPALLAQI